MYDYAIKSGYVPTDDDNLCVRNGRYVSNNIIRSLDWLFIKESAFNDEDIFTMKMSSSNNGELLQSIKGTNLLTTVNDKFIDFYGTNDILGIINRDVETEAYNEWVDYRDPYKYSTSGFLINTDNVINLRVNKVNDFDVNVNTYKWLFEDDSVANSVALNIDINLREFVNTNAFTKGKVYANDILFLCDSLGLS